MPHSDIDDENFERRSQALSATPLVVAVGTLTVLFALGLRALQAVAEWPAGLAADQALVAFGGVYAAAVLACCTWLRRGLDDEVDDAARVLEDAVRGLREGSVDPRTTLREGDPLQDLALELEDLASALDDQSTARRRLMAEIDASLHGADSWETRRLLTELNAIESERVGAGARLRLVS